MESGTSSPPDSPPTLLSNITTCIVGGGSSAHVLVPFLSENGHRVHLLTRRPKEWSSEIRCDVVYNNKTNNNNNNNKNGTKRVTTTHVGRLDRASDQPKDVIPDADVIILCLPVHQYRPALQRLAPHINRNKTAVYVGTIYGQGAFNLMVHHEVKQQHNLTNVVTFAIGSIPWICRTQEYGVRVANYGGKDVNLVAMSPKDEFQRLNRLFLQDLSERPLGKGAFRLVDNFLSLTLSVDNQIIHPARCYGLWLATAHGTWPSLDKVPYFYRDFDERSADILQRLDAEYELIRQAIRQRFPDRDFRYMLSYLELERLNHHSDDVDILQSLKNSQQLSQIQTPTVPGPDGESRRLDTNFRFFTDDIAYGLLIAKWIAEKLQISTPSMDEVIVWAQSVRGEYFISREGYIDTQWCLNQGKHSTGLPESYGVSNIEDLLD